MIKQSGRPLPVLDPTRISESAVTPPTGALFVPYAEPQTHESVSIVTLIQTDSCAAWNGPGLQPAATIASFLLRREAGTLRLVVRHSNQVDELNSIANN